MALELIKSSVIVQCNETVAYREGGVWGVQTPPEILKISVESSIA